MRYPKFLDKDKKLLFIAPSFGTTTEPYQSRMIKAYNRFSKKEYACDLGPNVFSSIGYRSNTNELCAKEFMDGYKNYDFLLSVGGGNLMNEILDYIDFDKIKELEPTWFMGYSDNTNISFVLTTCCDVASIYGYNACEFGSYKLSESEIDHIDLIEGKKLKFKGYPKFQLKPKKSENHPFCGYNLDTKKELRLFNDNNGEINMEGRLIGGCIDILTYLIGTPYDKVRDFVEKYKDDGIIWFLEACDLDPWNLKLALLQIKRHGWLKYVRGFMFGRPMHYKSLFINLDMYEAVYSVLKEYNLPIIMDCDFGHIKPCFPIICGSYAKVYAKDEIEIEYILK